MVHKNEGNTHNMLFRQFFKIVVEMHILKGGNIHNKGRMTHKNFQTFNSLYLPLKIRLEAELNKKSIELKKILI
jgi:hypothetical protein